MKKYDNGISLPLRAQKLVSYSRVKREMRHKISGSYQLSTQGQPKISQSNSIESVLGIYNCNDFCTCLNAE